MRKLFFAICLMVMTTYQNEAVAYQFTDDFVKGFYWAAFPFSLSKFATSSSDGEQLSSLVAQAEAEWEDAVGKDIWSIAGGYISSSGASGNSIRWSDDFGNETGYNPSSTLAITIRYASGTHVTKTEIILNGNFPGLRSNNNQMLYKTILHEMGHTIGLDHSSGQAIMAPYISGYQSLQWDDTQGAIAVIDEAQRRQAIGYVSEFSSQPEKQNALGSCGSVAFAGEGGATKAGFSFDFFGSLISGMIFLLFRRRRSRNGLK